MGTHLMQRLNAFSVFLLWLQHNPVILSVLAGLTLPFIFHLLWPWREKAEQAGLTATGGVYGAISRDPAPTRWHYYPEQWCHHRGGNRALAENPRPLYHHYQQSSGGQRCRVLALCHVRDAGRKDPRVAWQAV
jgi:hypothetical protein